MHYFPRTCKLFHLYTTDILLEPFDKTRPEIAKEIIKRKGWDGESPIMDVVKNAAYFMARQLAQKH